MRDVLHNYSDEDYKYISVVNINRLESIFESVKETEMPGYSIVILYHSNTYILGLFKNELNQYNYSIINYKNVKSKARDYEDYYEFLRELKNLFSVEDILVLLDMEYDREVISYPVTSNKYLRDNVITRTCELYNKHMPASFTFKNTDKFFTFMMVFFIVNLFVGVLCVLNQVSSLDLVFGIFTLISASLSLIYLLFRYAYRTSIVNGLIEAKRLFRFKKVYNFNEIKKVDDVILFNLFSTKKLYRLHMIDGSVVKIKYFNSSSSIEDDEAKEMIIYLRAKILDNKIDIKSREISNKLFLVLIAIIYIAVIIIL